MGTLPESGAAARVVVVPTILGISCKVTEEVVIERLIQRELDGFK
jgi:hypothetical protein